MTTAKVHVFLDDSNIFISAQREARKREGQDAKLQVRLAFSNLMDLALAGRQIGSACAIGSIPPDEREIWDRLEQATGVKPELYERGSETGKEQGVDQCLQVHMLRAIQDNPTPQIAVLLTGDGAGYDDGIGFHADLERMYDEGWGVEVISWRNACKPTLRNWASTNGVFIPLDDFYESITFLEGHRRVQPLNLSTRSLSKTRKSPAMLAEERLRAEYEAKLAEANRVIQALTEEKQRKAAGKARHDRRYARGQGRA